jgi:uncharacterized Zn finger protein
MWMGVMTHECTCPDYWLYGACKHALWATMLETGQSPSTDLDARPLAITRRALRALQPMANGQESMI